VYSSRVLHRRSILAWTCLFGFAVVTTGRLAVADDPAPSSSDGYKTIHVNSGGKALPIRVQEEKDPYQSVSSTDTSGKYNPEQIFSRTNAMANKKFMDSATFETGVNSDYKNNDQNTFITKPYSFDSDSSSIPNLHTKANFASTSAYNQRATGFDKNYATTTADAGQNQASLFASATSPDQGRTAVLGGQTTATFASPLTDKKFEGDEADAAKRHLIRMKTGQMLVEDLPDRPLTIDEVRDLLNHGFKPDTDAKPPEEQSKPLNDPDYKPEPLREAPAPPTPVNDDDKNDPVPPPGTMSAPPAPENSQPLPQP
jgi:hypothetical protein